MLVGRGRGQSLHSDHTGCVSAEDTYMGGSHREMLRPEVQAQQCFSVRLQPEQPHFSAIKKAVVKCGKWERSWFQVFQSVVNLGGSALSSPCSSGSWKGGVSLDCPSGFKHQHYRSKPLGWNNQTNKPKAEGTELVQDLELHWSVPHALQGWPPTSGRGLWVMVELWESESLNSSSSLLDRKGRADS